MTGSPAYIAITVFAIALSLALWSRRYRSSPRLPLVFIGGLVGAFVGAKLVFLLAEGWAPAPNGESFWMRLAAGKTVTGALLGGYAGIEWSKKQLGHREATGDFFAFIVPISLIFGRLGCWSQGCCLGRTCEETAWYAWRDATGISRWPAVPAEMLFNAVALGALFALRRVRALEGQLFHVYLIGYGTFRFGHEFLRDTPRIAGTVSGYQLAALAIVVLGIVRFRQRSTTTRKAAVAT